MWSKKQTAKGKKKKKEKEKEKEDEFTTTDKWMAGLHGAESVIKEYVIKEYIIKH